MNEPTPIKLDYWQSEESIRSMNKFMDRFNRYMFFFWKPEHKLIKERRAQARGRLYFCEYGQCSKIFTGYYDKDKKIIYKTDNYINTWMRPKFAVMIKYHNLMSI